MKKSMSREHADLLKRCYMSMGMDHDIMLGVQNRKAEAYDLLAHIHSEVHKPHIADGGNGSHHPCHCANCLLIDLLSRLSCLHVILKNGVMCILSIVKTGRFFPFSDSSGLVQGQNPQLRQLSQNFYCFYIKKKVICASS